MTSERLSKIFLIGFVLMFFLYLFAPLIVMSLSAFNSSEFPRVSPWSCFTGEWFDVLRKDTDLMEGLKNSVIIAFGVVFVSVPLGLAGALMLSQVSSRLRPWYYTIVISPILIPGVVLGISTLVFWDRMAKMFGAGYNSVFYDGLFLTIIGQSTFASAYAMLIFLSRLQRFDTVQEEAALDLGATNVQTFKRILLPFLKPAVASACVLSFLASFENYNTTIFTIVSKSTLTTVLASKVRYGINPSISALAVVIIIITLIGAVYFEILKRREEKYKKEVDRLAKLESTTRATRANLWVNPAMYIATIVFIAGLGTLYFAGTIGVDECKAVAKATKVRATELKIDTFKKKRMFKSAVPGTEVETKAAPAAKGKATGGGMFAPSNLEKQSGSGEQAPAEGTGSSGGMFSPQNLEGQTGTN
jgi:spermidine/putrescine transport system permease protein